MNKGILPERDPGDGNKGPGRQLQKQPAAREPVRACGWRDETGAQTGGLRGAGGCAQHVVDTSSSGLVSIVRGPSCYHPCSQRGRPWRREVTWLPQVPQPDAPAASEECGGSDLEVPVCHRGPGNRVFVGAEGPDARGDEHGREARGSRSPSANPTTDNGVG